MGNASADSMESILTKDIFETDSGDEVDNAAWRAVAAFSVEVVTSSAIVLLG